MVPDRAERQSPRVETVDLVPNPLVPVSGEAVAEAAGTASDTDNIVVVEPVTDTRSVAEAVTQTRAVTEQAGDDRSADRDPPLDVHALLTDSYHWDERSLRVAALQNVLNLGVDGRYSPDTRNSHLQSLEFVGLSIDGVPEAPPPGPSTDEWAAFRECESGGDYSIVSSSGRYRGAYQFARSTWDSVAGRHNPVLVGVDPATAPPAAQDAMALALHREAGSSPWPVCGRHVS